MKNKVIYQSLLFSAFLFLSYDTFIHFYRPNWSVAQYPQQDNIIKAENFLYSPKAHETIIVGSSLSTYLNMNFLPDVTNLAFSGMSIYEGLRILQKGNLPPKAVFIEMNVITRTEDKKFVESVTAPIPNALKRIFISLREDKQPLGIIALYIRLKIDSSKLIVEISKISNKFLGIFLDKATDSARSSVGDVWGVETVDDKFSELLRLQSKDYSKTPNIIFTNEQFASLKVIVDELEEKRIKVVFFEMPVDKSLCQMPKAKDIREKFYEVFPRNAYSYIDMPDCKTYKTVDGIHLQKEDAARYSKLLYQQMAPFLK
ncbi:hypothetical protein LEP1GSC047_1987 [Leptospira inadai serovar Lyme str. 10]|uniref:PF07611 family protein n=2 Tax=Leptospira inadai serovar Lyme TaxID=293084 RepID=V6HN15_9LEPT|nr:hypothetical protein [Leptospira inadai]EQA38285.1 hypothetical protein LEP1GSC047_1987 [Leptospira inadai serovar Lyme str. 10]PNV74386.1 hypothetical protein BES34_013540 [Leptospira inadai serovar Lyme]